ncbi:MAG: YnbE family lipoprotein [Proteobacteria bacterium]|nr:YnbE family lipoprotein [Pseudomonadota bacterium]
MLGLVLTVALLLAACQPTVRIVPPDKPIVINLNIKIEQEIRIKVDKALDDLLMGDEGLF